MVNLRTTRFSTQRFYILPRLCIDPQNSNYLPIHYKGLVLVIETRVYCAVWTGHLNIFQVDSEAFGELTRFSHCGNHYFLSTNSITYFNICQFLAFLCKRTLFITRNKCAVVWSSFSNMLRYQYTIFRENKMPILKTNCLLKAVIGKVLYFCTFCS